MARWARFQLEGGGTGFGALEDSQVSVYEGEMFGDKRPTGRRLDAAAVTLLSPCAPSKIVALWNNFHALCAKLGKTAPRHPQFLLKPGTCVIGPDAVIKRPETYPGKIVFEGELGVVLGKTCMSTSLCCTSVASRYMPGGDPRASR